MKTMLGKTKVRGMSENDPITLIKSPRKGKAAATNIFAVKITPRTKNLRLMFSRENMLSSSTRSFVSKVS